MEKYYTVYKTVNNINGRYYIGCHKTKDIDDKYMGSGRLIKKAIEKYGVENFTKQILFVYDNPEQMYAKEAEIVTDEFLMEENTYNLTIGGHGSFSHVNEDEKLRKKKNLKAYKNAKLWEYNKDRHRGLRDAYYDSPKVCGNCGVEIPYKKRHNVYCSRSCGVTAGNKQRLKPELTKKEDKTW